MKNEQPYFNSRALFSGICLSYVYVKSGSMFWVAYIIGTILGVTLLNSVKITHNKYIKALVGSVLAYLSMTILINMAHTLYLENTPLWLITIFSGVMLACLVKSEKKPYKKVLNIFFVYSLILFGLKILTLAPQVKLDHFRPLLVSDLSSVWWTSIVVSLAGVVPILSFNDLHDKKSVNFSYLLSMVTVLTVSFLAVGVLGLKEVIIYRYPEYMMFKKINILDFISNVDHIFSFVIILDLMFTIRAGIKSSCELGSNFKYLSLIGVSILSYITCNLNYPLLLIYNFFPYILIFLLILLIIPKK